VSASIPLTQGYFAIVDDEDAERVLAHKWCAAVTWNGDVYALRMTSRRDGPRKQIYLHRWLMDAPPGVEVDHKNHNTLDNRRSVNLRLATRSQQLANARRRSRSGYRGVRKIGKRWQARVTNNGVQAHIGYFDSAEDAARAYDAAAVAAHGEFATRNFPA
jgi:hypothetical protein